MPKELKYYTILFVGILATSMIIASGLAMFGDNLTKGDRIGVFYGGILFGAILGTIIPPIMVFGKQSSINTNSRVLWFLLGYFVVAGLLSFFVFMLSLFSVIPLGIIYRIFWKVQKRK